MVELVGPRGALEDASSSGFSRFRFLPGAMSGESVRSTTLEAHELLRVGDCGEGVLMKAAKDSGSGESNIEKSAKSWRAC